MTIDEYMAKVPAGRRGRVEEIMGRTRSWFPDARITGTYILDPWFPRVSSIWGPSDPPGTFQDLAEMRRNYLVWQRPEGNYADRDGLFIAVVPTIPLDR